MAWHLHRLDKVEGLKLLQCCGRVTPPPGGSHTKPITDPLHPLQPVHFLANARSHPSSGGPSPEVNTEDAVATPLSGSPPLPQTSGPGAPKGPVPHPGEAPLPSTSPRPLFLSPASSLTAQLTYPMLYPTTTRASPSSAYVLSPTLATLPSSTSAWPSHSLLKASCPGS